MRGHTQPVVLTGSWAPMARSLMAGLVGRGHDVALAAVDDSDVPLRWPSAQVVDPRLELERVVPEARAVVLISGVGPISSLVDDSFTLDYILGCARPGTVLIEMTSAALAVAGSSRPAQEELVDSEEVPPGLEPMRSAEQRVLAAADWLRPAVIRTGLVYEDGGGGPWLQAAVAHATATGVSRYFGGGEESLPVVHLDDLIGLLDLVLRDGSASGVFHAAASHLTSRSLAELVAAAAGVPDVQAWDERSLREALGVDGAPVPLDVVLSTTRGLDAGWTPRAASLEQVLSVPDTSWPVTG